MRQVVIILQGASADFLQALRQVEIHQAETAFQRAIRQFRQSIRQRQTDQIVVAGEAQIADFRHAVRHDNGRHVLLIERLVRQRRHRLTVDFRRNQHMFARPSIIGNGHFAVFRRAVEIRRGIDPLVLPMEHAQRLTNFQCLLHKRVVVVGEHEEVQVARIPNPEDVKALPVHLHQHRRHVVDGHFLQARALRGRDAQHHCRAFRDERGQPQPVARLIGRVVRRNLHHHQKLFAVVHRVGNGRHAFQLYELIAPIYGQLKNGVVIQLQREHVVKRHPGGRCFLRRRADRQCRQQQRKGQEKSGQTRFHAGFPPFVLQTL